MPSGQFEFAWSGDESHTVMHYLASSNGFGRFDRDNVYRWETAGYLNWSNAVLGDILADRDAHRVQTRSFAPPTERRPNRSTRSATGSS